MAQNVTRETTNYGFQKVFAGLVALQTGLKTVLELIDTKLYNRTNIYIPFHIPAAELAAGTSIEMLAPFSGKLRALRTIIQTDIVTGGVVSVKIGTTDVAGLSVTVANGATKGTVQADSTASDTGTVVFGDRIQIVPSAAFNGGGEIRGFLRLRIED